MSFQGRVTDNALVPADSHGCPACPHCCVGAAVSGSPNVNVNGLAALRAPGDPGIHAACCGPNAWDTAMGSGKVYINGMAAHRLGDMTTHCGGVGTLISGSGNVNVG